MSYFKDFSDSDLRKAVEGDSDTEYDYMIHNGFTDYGGDRDLSDVFCAYYWDGYKDELNDELKFRGWNDEV